MRLKLTHVLFMVIWIVVFSSCQKEIEKYERPEWLKGKLYTQVASTEDLDSFAVCLLEVGLDSLIDRSGSFTVFAPTNEAFQAFFQQSPEYNSIADIPQNELVKIARYHIVQNSWSSTQLRTLNSGGWVDPENPKSLPWGFKRQTILLNSNKKYWVTRKSNEYILSDSLSTDRNLMVLTNSRKYVPIFFDEYLSISELSVDDYEFYFPSGFQNGTFHYGGAHVISSEIYAENGILYKIDQVVNPLKNVNELLQEPESDHEYNDFLELIYNFGELNPNIQETMKQPGFDEGLAVDTIFNLTFPELLFNIANERTDDGNENNTISMHYGIIAPTDQALNNLFSQVVTGPGRWSSKATAPEAIHRIIVNSHMSESALYPKDYNQGFKNGENDEVNVNLSNVVQANFASNSTFIGVDEAIIPRAFTSITAPVYLSPGFSMVQTVVERSTTLPTLKRKNQNYTLLIPSTSTLTIDSSFYFGIPSPNNPYFSPLIGLNRSTLRSFTWTKNAMINLIFNHTGTEIPSGLGRKEFIPNLAGNYLVFDWVNGYVTGGASSVFGFGGDSSINIVPEPIEDFTIDNGEVYQINGWLNFAKGDMYGAIRRNTGFSGWLTRAGLFDNTRFSVRIINPGEKYTVFIPTNEAIQNFEQNFDIAGMSTEELTELIKYHFVREDIIFTDGKQPASDYVTLSRDENSEGSGVQKTYSKLKLLPGVDYINILNPDGSLYYRVDEDGSNTNILVAENFGDEENPNYITQAVVHLIDTVLVKPN